MRDIEYKNRVQLPIMWQVADCMEGCCDRLLTAAVCNTTGPTPVYVNVVIKFQDRDNHSRYIAYTLAGDSAASSSVAGGSCSWWVSGPSGPSGMPSGMPLVWGRGSRLHDRANANGSVATMGGIRRGQVERGGESRRPAGPPAHGGEANSQERRRRRAFVQ